jgi:lipopolysaccharide/colanic/teichoic acid biosynthesis glycosyltransferase
MNAANFVAGALLAHQVASRPYFREQLALRVNQFIALILWCIFSPLLLIIAFLIWRVDGAPILFGHYRVGKNGRLFRCWKFRSMRRDSAQVLENLLKNDPAARAEWERDQKLTNDPRITRIGHFLRKSSLDELPQLLNVIKGEMALVGPRPVTVAELTRYGNTRWHYVSVPPGMTGLWQISGRNNTTYAERVAFDREYVERRSLAGDLGILVKTVRVVMFREGAK